MPNEKQILRVYWQHYFERITDQEMAASYRTHLDELSKLQAQQRNSVKQWPDTSFIAALYKTLDKKCEELLFAIERGKEDLIKQHFLNAIKYPQLIGNMITAANHFKSVKQIHLELPNSYPMRATIESIQTKTAAIIYNPTNDELMLPTQSINTVKANTQVLKAINVKSAYITPPKIKARLNNEEMAKNLDSFNKELSINIRSLLKKQTTKNGKS